MPERSPKGPLASPGYHLWNASLRWAAAVATALGPVDLTHVQFFILGGVSWLGKTREPPTQVEVADFCSMDRMMVSKVVRALEGRGMLRRQDDPTDARAWRLHLTAKGEQLIPRAAALVRAVDASFFDAISPRTAQLADDLRRLTEKTRDDAAVEE